MLYLLIIGWVLSPFVLLPLYIHEKNKAGRLSRFLDELRSKGRISPQERSTLRPDITAADNTASAAAPEAAAYIPPAEYVPADSVTETAFVPETASVSHTPAEEKTAVYTAYDTGAASPAEEPQSVPDSFLSDKAAFSFTAPKKERAAAQDKTRRKADPTTVILGIGSALIILAGIIFSKMAWLTMTDLQRTGMIALAGVFFFAVGIFSLRKLKLGSTGMAFYLLGSAFASITFLTAGYFGIMGEWLSVSGGGLIMLIALTVLIMTAFMAGAVKLFNKGGFFHAALYGGLISFTLMSLQLIDDREWWTFTLNLIAAVPIYLIVSNKYGSGVHSQAVKLFTIVFASLYAASAVPYMLIGIGGRWHTPTLLTSLLWLAQALAYSFIHRENKKLRYLHTLLSTLVVYEASAVILRGTDSVRAAFITACGMFLLTALYRLVPAMRSLLSDFLPAVGMVLFLLFLSGDPGETNVTCCAVIAFLTALTAVYNALSEDSDTARIYRCFAPIALAAFAVYLSGAVTYPAIKSFHSRFAVMLALLCFASGIVSNRLPRLRTWLSDITFPAVMLFAALTQILSGGSWLFALTAVLMGFIACGKDTAAAKILRGALFLPLTLFAVFAPYDGLSFGISGDAFREEMSSALILFVLALGVRWSDRVKLRLRTAVSDIIIPVILFFWVKAYYLSFDPRAKLVPMMLLIFAAVLLLTCIFEKSPKRPVSSAIAKRLLPFDLMAAAIVVYEDHDMTLSHGQKPDLFPQIMTSFAIIVILFAVFRFVKKLRTGTSDFLIPLGLVNLCCGAYLCPPGSRSAVLLPVMLAALCGMYILLGHGRNIKGYSILHRIAAPLALTGAVFACGDLYTQRHHSSGSFADAAYLPMILAAVGIAVTFTMLARKAKDERVSQYDQSKYIWAAAAGSMAAIPVFQPHSNCFALSVCLLISVFLYLLALQFRNNITSAVNTAVFLASALALEETAAADLRPGSDSPLVLVMLFSAALMICGRMLFKDRIINRQNGIYRTDFAAFGVFLIPILILSAQRHLTPQERGSLVLIITSAATANLIRKKTAAKTKKILFSVSSALLCLLVYTRPFLLDIDRVLEAKINLIPLLMFGAVMRYIWREDKLTASKLSFVSNVAALAMLMFDALANRSTGNTIFVLAVNLCITLWAYGRKNAKWFAISSASLLGMTLYISRELFGSLEWWAYLLIAGVILITVAAVNEYLKSRGMTLRDAAAKLRSRWQK